MHVFLVSPPFTQLNTPYPATAYLKGFLNTKGISSTQADLGLEVILKIFSKAGLRAMFDRAETSLLSNNAQRIYNLREEYIAVIDQVVQFLQGQNPTLSLQISQGNYLPQASRFDSISDLEWAFGTMGDSDRAKHLATLFMEDIADFIVEAIDPHFGFSRYAERLGRSANRFDGIDDALKAPATYIDALLFDCLAEHFAGSQPDLVLISVPFPGNLYAGFRTAQYIKSHFPNVKIAMGGGFPNTELRSLSDARVFDFVDFVSLDDGEAPVENLIEYLAGGRTVEDLKRTFVCREGTVSYMDGSLTPDYKMSDVGTPDYDDLLLDRYLSVIEIANPMHRLWSDGRWNKLTMAHGCYWGKCTFCDISLDYIRVYEPVAAKLLCDRIEQMMLKTGQSGFHFVDEAAPPALMRELALEIIRRGLQVTWWTNIRFEKSFSYDLCRLLRASGCIAVSGGLEVASDRLLALIEKGVTVAQVARVTDAFTKSGIMVHAYLMYGFPSQTVQETVDSLEMVRQLFEAGALQSGFWHQFAMTAHSPVGINPELFGVVPHLPDVLSFANNDIDFTDQTGVDHGKFSFGLKKSLYNFMHGIGLDFELQEWFGFRIPKPTVSKDFIAKVLNETPSFAIKPNAKVTWIGPVPYIDIQSKSKKGKVYEVGRITCDSRTARLQCEMAVSHAEFIVTVISELSRSGKPQTLGAVKQRFETRFEDFELFWFSKPMSKMKEAGLLVI